MSTNRLAPTFYRDPDDADGVIIRWPAPQVREDRVSDPVLRAALEDANVFAG